MDILFDMLNFFEHKSLYYLLEMIITLKMCFIMKKGEMLFLVEFYFC